MHVLEKRRPIGPREILIFSVTAGLLFAILIVALYICDLKEASNASAERLQMIEAKADMTMLFAASRDVPKGGALNATTLAPVYCRPEQVPVNAVRAPWFVAHHYAATNLVRGEVIRSSDVTLAPGPLH